MTVTMKEIARLAGVSQPAVSAALNGSGTTKVSDEMRQKIQDLARELNYTPNNAAQRLKGGASKTIGVFGVPYISALAQAQLLAISLELGLQGYNLLSCYGEPDTGSMNAIRSMTAKGVDGIIVTTQENPMQNFKSPPVPYVFCPPCPCEDFDVAVDHRRGCREATESLLAAGCRRIAFLGIQQFETEQDSPINFEKYQGICEAQCKHGVPLLPELKFSHEEFHYSPNQLLLAVRRLQPDAIFCANDFLAAKLIRILQKNDIAVPQDIKVVGYDGLSVCELTVPALASVIQPNLAVAKNAVDLLMQRINRNERGKNSARILCAPYFYPNESCGFTLPGTETLASKDTYSTLELNWKFNSERNEL